MQSGSEFRVAEQGQQGNIGRIYWPAGQSFEEMTIYDDGDAVADSKYENDTVIRAIHEKPDERPDLKIKCL